MEERMEKLERRVQRIEDTLDKAFANYYQDAMAQLGDAFWVWNAGNQNTDRTRDYMQLPRTDA